ncbi:MAG: hypothetical protein Q9224_007282, partial [Gallowayella concinna]
MSPMEIDLDAIFGGQGATDLDDDYYDMPSEPPPPPPSSAPQVDDSIMHPRLYHIWRDLTDDRDLTIPDPSYRPPIHSLWKRAANSGAFLYCDGINVAAPPYQPSPLRTIESAYPTIIINTPAITDDGENDNTSSSSSPSSPSSSSPSSSSSPATSISPSPTLSPLDIATSPLLLLTNKDDDDDDNETSTRRSAIYMACV